MGSITLMKEGMKTFFRTHPHIRRKAMGLVIDICFDETLADADNSKTLSMKEALTFSAAMSLDSLASGLGAGLMPEGIPLCLVLTLLLGYVLTVAGCHVEKGDMAWRYHADLARHITMACVITKTSTPHPQSAAART